MQKQKQQKTHWKQLTNPDYIGAYAFQPGEEKHVTISKVTRETVTGPDGRKEECSVLHFTGDIKPLILNITNAKMISKLLRTPYIEEWTDKTITLIVETVNAFGERVDAVRVKKSLPTLSAPVCARCGQVITGTDKFTAQQIAQAGLNRFGQVVCLDCAEGAKAEQGAAVDIEEPKEKEKNSNE